MKNLKNPASSAHIPLRSAGDLLVIEKHVEEFFATHLQDLIPENQLLLIGQERQYQEEADLLALDRAGTLYIFELKRWQSTSENLLQVLRYGQKFGRYTYSELQQLAVRHQKLQGSLSQRHQIYFDLVAPLPEGSFNVDQVFVVVTNGADRDTLEAIKYWSRKRVRIDCVTYKLYEIEGKPHVYFDVYNPEREVLVEEHPGTYIVNTNATYRDDAWKDMLSAPKAAAYYDRKHAVANIPKGSTVYLYHTGIGVIAKGKTTATFRKADYDGDTEEEFYVPLNLEWKLEDPQTWDRAVKAWEINQRLNTGHCFRQTAFAISDQMVEAIEAIWREHGKT